MPARWTTPTAGLARRPGREDRGGTDHRICFFGGCTDKNPYTVSRYSGRSAGDGTVRYDPFYYDKAICAPDTRFNGCRVFVHNDRAFFYSWFNAWVASTVYTADPLKDDRLVKLDLTPITPKSSSCTAGDARL